jgi:hypothetical protein
MPHNLLTGEAEAKICLTYKTEFLIVQTMNNQCLIKNIKCYD